jgi:hypothetical protein
MSLVGYLPIVEGGLAHDHSREFHDGVPGRIALHGALNMTFNVTLALMLSLYGVLGAR